MIFPKPLTAGATVGLIAPCSAISPQREKKCIETLESLDFKVKKASNLTENYGGYMAGPAKERAVWINRMFEDPEVDLILCVRAGDGSMRTMEYLDLELIKNNPKPFVGFGDITPYHLALNQTCEMVTFHGPMVATNFINAQDSSALQSMLDALCSRDCYELKNPEGYPFGVLKPGKASGKLIGGNLSLMSACMGTECQPDGDGKIIFMEEISESVSEMDRRLCQLKYAGVFDNCRGVILGQFQNVANEFMPEYSYLKLVEDILSDIDIPIMYNIQSGHGKQMVTLPMGAVCTMDTEQKTITFDMRR